MLQLAYGAEVNAAADRSSVQMIEGGQILITKQADGAERRQARKKKRAGGEEGGGHNCGMCDEQELEAGARETLSKQCHHYTPAPVCFLQCNSQKWDEEMQTDACSSQKIDQSSHFLRDLFLVFEWK